MVIEATGADDIVQGEYADDIVQGGVNSFSRRVESLGSTPRSPNYSGWVGQKETGEADSSQAGELEKTAW